MISAMTADPRKVPSITSVATTIVFHPSFTKSVHERPIAIQSDDKIGDTADHHVVTQLDDLAWSAWPHIFNVFPHRFEY